MTNYKPFWIDKYKDIYKDISKNLDSKNINLEFVGNESIETFRSIKIEFVPNKEQLSIFNDWFNVSTYLYNKTVETIKNGHIPNFISLRNLLVSENTKTKNPKYIEILKKIKELKKSTNKESEIKLLRNEIKNISSVKNNINEWELIVPKEIRASVVKEVCTAHKSAQSNKTAGNIKKFSIGYRKKYNHNLSIPIPKSLIKKLSDESIQIAPTFLKGNKKFNLRKNALQNIEINNDCKILRQNGLYFLSIPICKKIEKTTNLTNVKFCGIDPGVRTFMSSYNSDCSVSEYKHNIELLNKLNNKIKLLKERRIGKGIKRLRKKTFYKIENKKANYIDELHNKTIRSILDHNNIIFYGDIKSHDIVKNKEHQKKLNSNVNDLKFYKFKQRLLNRSKNENKIVYEIAEPFTTKTCSSCGQINNPEASTVFNCSSCKLNIGRDVNASKNICMKGIVQHLKL